MPTIDLDELSDRFGGELIKLDFLDECVVGVVERFGQEPCLCYSREKIIAKLVQDGCDYDEAVEYFEFNIAGAWVGPHTPCFLSEP